MNGTSKTELAIQKIQEARDTSKTRYLDMQIAIYRPSGVQPILRVGGRWDTREREYAGPAETECEIMLTESQLPAWQQFADWLARYVDVRRLVATGAIVDDALAVAWGEQEAWFTAQWYGGRRAGKTFLACVAASLVGVAVPGARCGAVVPTDEKREEMKDLIEGHCLPAEWRTYKAGEIRLANGSQVKLQTGSVTDLKAMGSLDLAILNEAQEQKESNWLDMQGNVVDRAGLCILAQNPPRSNRGRWSQVLFDKAKRGEVGTVRPVWFDPSKNPHKSQRALMALKSLMDSRVAAREVGGDMGVAIGDIALHVWSDSVHVIGWIPSTWVDVTQEETLQRFGVQCTKIGGLDWDKGAGCSYVVGRLFRPRGAPQTSMVLVVEYGHRCQGLAEARFPEHLKTLKDRYGLPLVQPQSMIWIGDASSRTQSTARKHNEDDPPSWERMAREGWRVTYPDASAKRNPRRADRFGLVNQYVLQKQPDIDQPRALFLTDTAQEVIKDARSLPRKGLEADRFSKHAHVTDAWTYLVYRLWSQDFIARQNDGIPEVVGRTRRQTKL